MYWFYNDVFFFYLFIFVVPVITIWGSKTASIIFKSILFDGKVNLVGARKGWEKQKKLRKSGNFYAISVLDKIHFGFWCNS